MRQLLLLLAIWAYPMVQLFSISAYNKPILAHQPDGSIVTLTLTGDEHHKLARNSEGFSLISNSVNQWVYAMEDSSGCILPSKYLANDQLRNDPLIVSFLKNQPKGIQYKALNRNEVVKGIAPVYRQPRKTKAASGNRKGLVILMNFSDVSFSIAKLDVDNLFNAKDYVGLSSGSVRDFFLKNSFNQMDYTFDVVGPYRCVHNMAYYGANNYSGNDKCPEELIKEAVVAASSNVNFADYDCDNDGYVDNVHIVFAGYGEESGASSNSIWSHKSALPDPLNYNGKIISAYSCAPELRGTSSNIISPIGVHCHELTHTLGVPDFYDTDGAENGYFLGTGDWDLMASGSWNNKGDTPAEINPYSKIYILGWAEARTLIDSTMVNVKYQCRENSFYRINTQTTNEFFLLENRQQIGFDAYLPHHGLLIYHIHSNMNFDNNDLNATYPQKCYPIVASSIASIPNSTPSSYGEINSIGCPYPGYRFKCTFSDDTTPCAKSWSGKSSNCFITDIQEVDSLIKFNFARNPDGEGPKASDTTVLYSEMFDEGFPKSWSQKVFSGSRRWTLLGGGLKTTDTLSCIFLNGNKMSSEKSTTMAITRELDLTSSEPVYLSFSFKCLNSAGLSVYYTLDSNANWIRVDSLNGSENWRSVMLPLTNTSFSFALGFRGSCEANGVIYLDSVKVFTVKDVISKVKAVDADEEDLKWYISTNEICIESLQEGLLNLYDLHGSLIRKIALSHGLAKIHMPSGLYIYKFNRSHGLIYAP